MNESSDAQEERSVPAAGIPCPRCRGTVWSVYKTQPEVGRIVRIRTCKGCRLRIRSAERIEAVLESRPTAAEAGG